MQNIITWLRKNALLVILVLLVAYLAGQSIFSLPGRVMTQRKFSYDAAESAPVALDLPMGKGAGGSVTVPMPIVPPSTSVDRKVIRDTYLSMVVKDVASAIRQIEQKTVALGGFMVNSSLSTPEEGGTGMITVRVPVDRREEAVNAFRTAGVRVVSEHISGNDVTDQYEDLGERLAILGSTKEKFQAILAQATRVEDMLRVQQELINLQSQIDALKGQQEYLDKTAELTLISANLSVDEFSLPYAPNQPWRPAAVYKQAVRSLVLMSRGLASLAIWIAVFAPLWGGVLLILWWLRRRLAKS